MIVAAPIPQLLSPLGGGGSNARVPRAKLLSYVAILPWVRVPHLASHLLGGLTRRIAQDWQQRHGWPLELLESFVESGRFPGLCYRAANWLEVGQTTGRTRQHKQHRAVAPRKSVWVYGLSQRFRVYVGVRGRRGGAP